MGSFTFRRHQMIQEMGPVCVGCLKEFDPDDLTVDHIIPRSKGGCSCPLNLQLMCSPCNREKGSLLLGGTQGHCRNVNDKHWCAREKKRRVREERQLGLERVKEEKVRFLIERDGALCAECGEWRDLKIVCIRPRLDDGCKCLRNLRLLCGPCKVFTYDHNIWDGISGHGRGDHYLEPWKTS